jgi:hypothetical protein
MRCETYVLHFWCLMKTPGLVVSAAARRYVSILLVSESMCVCEMSYLTPNRSLDLLVLVAAFVLHEGHGPCEI